MGLRDVKAALAARDIVVKALSTIADMLHRLGLPHKKCQKDLANLGYEFVQAGNAPERVRSLTPVCRCGMGDSQQRALAECLIGHSGGFAVQLGLGQNGDGRAEALGGPQRHLPAKVLPVPLKHRRLQLRHDLIRGLPPGGEAGGQ
jgi:hypothetical protein